LPTNSSSAGLKNSLDGVFVDIARRKHDRHQASDGLALNLAAHFQAVNFATAIQIEQHEIEGLFANDVEAFFAIPARRTSKPLQLRGWIAAARERPSSSTNRIFSLTGALTTASTDGSTAAGCNCSRNGRHCSDRRRGRNRGTRRNRGARFSRLVTA